MKDTRRIILSEKEVKEIIGKELNIDPRNITYCGWSGILNCGEFRVEVYEQRGRE